MEIDKKSVGLRIKSIRKNKGMNLEEFGKLFNVSKSNISHWEAGNTLPNAERTKAIAKIADITVDELLYGSELTPHQVKDMLLNNSLQPLLDDKLKIFIEKTNSSNYTGLDFDKNNYFIKLYGRMKIVAGTYKYKYPGDFISLRKVENELISKISKEIISDLLEDIPELETNNYTYMFDIVTNFLNDKENTTLFFDYLIKVCDSIAKYDALTLEFMLSRKIGLLINDINDLLENPEYTEIKIQQYGAFIEPQAIINTIDYDTYKELQKRLVDVAKFVRDNLTPIN